MKKARRVPRKVGHDDEDEITTANISTTSIEPISAVKRPTLSARNSLKPKPSSSARFSSAIGAGTDEQVSSDGDTDQVINKLTRKPNLSRHVLQRNVELASQRRLPRTEEPSYSADYLAELKSSTPSTPRELVIRSDQAGRSDVNSLDLAAKFSEAALVRHADSAVVAAIPTDAEIREKKERRRRLAKEQEYISLNDDDHHNEASQSDGSDNDDPRSRSLIIPADEIKLNDKYGETRLVHEDEDIAEGFDSFVEDAGKVTLKSKAAKEQERQRKRDMAAQIRSAQHGYGYGAGVSDEEDDEDEDEVDEEEVARNVAYEAAQTRAGTYGTSHAQKWEKEKESSLRRRLEAQPKLRPIPDLKIVVARFWETVKAKEAELALSRKRLEVTEREKEEIDKEAIRIQELLKEAGERYDRLKAEMLAPPPAGDAADGETDAKPPRGLDNLGGPVKAEAAPEDEVDSGEMNSESADAVPRSMGMGMGMGMGMDMGARSFTGMGSVAREEDAWD